MTRLHSLQRLHHLLSDQFIPSTPDDFIGPSRTVASGLLEQVTDARAMGNVPMRIMLNGPPGVGKSALARYLQKLLGVHPKWSTMKYSGVDVTIETVRDLANR